MLRIQRVLLVTHIALYPRMCAALNFGCRFPPNRIRLSGGIAGRTIFGTSARDGSDDDKERRTGNDDAPDPSAAAVARKPEFQRIPILRYEDTWLCVNKPPGITVHPVGKTFRRETKNPVLTKRLKRQLRRKVYPAHRLDHRTSGAMLLGFDGGATGAIHTALRAGSKTYVALVRGDWDWNHADTLTCDEPVTTDGVEKGARTVFTKLASTEGRGDQRDAGSDGYEPACTLLLADPKTGRTHQIRKHLFSLGHPVLGDSQHGDTRVNRYWRQTHGLDRLALHCLALDLPEWEGAEGCDTEESDSGNRVVCVAPLLEDFSAVLRKLGPLWDEALEKEPRLAENFYDYRGGSFGSGTCT